MQQIASNAQKISKASIRDRRIIIEEYISNNSIKTCDSINKAIEKAIVYTITKLIKNISTIIITIEKSNANKLLEYKEK